MDSLTEEIDQASTPKKMRLMRMNTQEEMMVQIKNESREGQGDKKKKALQTLRSHLIERKWF